MAEIKTKATDVSVDEHIAAIANETQRGDAQALAKLLGKITGEKPRMWGPTIIGFGSYHYRYESGHEGEMCIAGFAARKNELVVYLNAGGEGRDELLTQLGRHRTGKACLYLRRLDEIDLAVLEKLVRSSIAETRRRYG